MFSVERLLCDVSLSLEQNVNIQLQPAIQLAAWIQTNHPALFNVLLKRAKSQALHGLYPGSFIGRLGQDDLSDYFNSADAADAVANSDLSATDSGAVLPEITVTAENPNSTELTGSGGGAGSDEEATSIQTAIANETAMANIPMTAVTADISGPAPSVNITPDSVPTTSTSSTSSALSAVGNYLTSAQGITTLLKGAATIATTNATAALIQSQAQRAAAGLAPANVSYGAVTDPNTGIVTPVPVLNTAAGASPLSAAQIANLAPSTFLAQYGVYLLIGGIILFAMME